MWVIKLGGSLAGSRELKSWLASIVRYGKGRIVVVPGGGPFAEAIRALQPRLKFNDAIAHRMGVLAMEQYAHMLCGMCRGLVPADSEAAIESALRRKSIPIWLPSRMLTRSRHLPQNWDVTSDSLAAWLAMKLSARCLLLVKSCAVPTEGTAPAQWARDRIVDPMFPVMTRKSSIGIHILNKKDHARLTKWLA
jgi:aspartokinase-like uncharacterized kinase